jgi:hypothetical protein
MLARQNEEAYTDVFAEHVKRSFRGTIGIEETQGMNDA